MPKKKKMPLVVDVPPPIGGVRLGAGNDELDDLKQLEQLGALVDEVEILEEEDEDRLAAERAAELKERADKLEQAVKDRLRMVAEASHLDHSPLDSTERIEELKTKIDKQEHEMRVITDTMFDPKANKKRLKQQEKQHAKAMHAAAKHKNDPPRAHKEQLYRSNNTLEEVQRLEEKSWEAVPDNDHIQWVWALVFDMPEESRAGSRGANAAAATADDVIDEAFHEEDDHELEANMPQIDDVNASRPSPNGELKVSHEAWMACVKIVACDLVLRHVVPIDHRYLIVAIGAPNHILVREAAHLRLLMRLQESKGAMEFHEDLLHYFASNHGGLNEYVAHKWLRRNATDIHNHFMTNAELAQQLQNTVNDRSGNDDLDDLEQLEELETLADEVETLAEEEQAEQEDRPAARLRKDRARKRKQGAEDRQKSTRMQLEDNSRNKPYLDELLKLRKAREKKVFTSALCQRIVMSRLTRVGHYHPDQQQSYRLSGGHPDIRALEKLSNKCEPTHRKDIPAQLVHDVLTLFGGYRPNAGSIFPEVKGEAVVAQVAAYCIADDSFNLKHKGGGDEAIPGGGPYLDTHKSVSLHPVVDYHLLTDLVEALEKWREGVGREEVWYGTLNNFFPLHSSAELKYLKNSWGSPKCLIRSCLIGYDPEDEPKVYDPGPPKDIEHNTFGACGNILHEHAFPRSLLYQPLEEIRDYFGDDVGLYFAWLGLYTAMLIPNTILGFITMAAQIYFGGGVSNNPLIMTYSIYVGLWSISFIEAWHRRENELRFLWGTEHLVTIEQPRIEFKGIIKSNLETGRSYKAVENPWTDRLKMTASAVAVLLFVAVTIVSAIAAQKISYTDPDGEGVWEEYKYPLISAALNLSIIVVYGIIFEALADKLTAWENHRTQTQYDDQLIAKNSVFQFVNNYFVLFYIAFLREFKDPFTQQAHPCNEGNCLPELQTQLFVVFTGKTVGKQLAYTIKPFLFKWHQSISANRHTKKLVQGVSKGSIIIPSQMQAAMQEAVSTAGGRNDPLQQLKQLTKLRDPLELQNRLMPYEGTFDDFNDRVVQFGYLVLFAPGYSLAPFFALVNNIIEIRTAGFKMCYAYQRPVWKARSGIGSWITVLNVLGFLAVFTNAAMITFVGTQEARDIGLDTTGFLDRARQWPLWLRFVLTEHCVLAMRVIILSVSPTMPVWINDAREVLQYRIQNRYRTPRMVEEAARLQEVYENKMNNELERIKIKLTGMSEDDIHRMWLAADYDRSGSVDAAELQAMFKKLGVEMSSKQVMTTMEEIDADASGNISYEEMIDWLMDKDLWNPKDVPVLSPGSVPLVSMPLGNDV